MYFTLRYLITFSSLCVISWNNFNLFLKLNELHANFKRMFTCANVKENSKFLTNHIPLIENQTWIRGRVVVANIQAYF